MSLGVAGSCRVGLTFSQPESGKNSVLAQLGQRVEIDESNTMLQSRSRQSEALASRIPNERSLHIWPPV